MSVQCKAYLLQDGAKEPSEIRNFRLDEGAASNYDYLKKKIATIFPNLGWNEDGSAFKLLWKDSAGDLITFSSDEELVDALGEVAKEGVFRVYIQYTSKKQDDFPWQSYMNEFLKSRSSEAQSAGQSQKPFSYPYARRGACGGRRGFCNPSRGQCGPCGPQRQRCPPGFFFDSFPRTFPGFHAEVWASFNGDDFEPPQGFCGQWQNQEQAQSSEQEKPATPKKSDKPSTSSS